jgi:hypothetical protein
MKVEYRGHTIQIDDMVAAAVEEYLCFSVGDITELDSSVAIQYDVGTDEEIEQVARTHTTQELERQINVELVQQLNCFASGWRGQLHGERKQGRPS